RLRQSQIRLKVLNEPLVCCNHARGCRVSAIKLNVGICKAFAWVRPRIEVAELLILLNLENRYRLPALVRIGFCSAQTLEFLSRWRYVILIGIQEAKKVIERTILQHDDNEMIDSGYARRHG